jgi:hypothetical protein
MSHGGLNRARSWKRRIQPKEAYSSPGLLYSESCENAWLQRLSASSGPQFRSVSRFPLNLQVCQELRWTARRVLGYYFPDQLRVDMFVIFSPTLRWQ